MKQISKLLSLGLLLFIVGCRGGCNPAICRQTVVAKHGPEVASVGTVFHFIARDTNGSIWYVEVDGAGPEITAETQLFGPSK